MGAGAVLAILIPLIPLLAILALWVGSLYEPKLQNVLYVLLYDCNSLIMNL